MKYIKRGSCIIMTLIFLLLNSSIPVVAYSRTEPYIVHDQVPYHTDLEYTLSTNWRRFQSIYSKYFLRPLGEITEEDFLLRVKKVGSTSYYWEEEVFFEETGERKLCPVGITFSLLRVEEKLGGPVSDEYDLIYEDISVGDEIYVAEYYTFLSSGYTVDFLNYQHIGLGGFRTWDSLFCEIGNYSNMVLNREYILKGSERGYYSKAKQDYSPFTIFYFSDSFYGEFDNILYEGMNGHDLCKSIVIPQEYIPDFCIFDYIVVDFSEERYQEACEFLIDRDYDPTLGVEHYKKRNVQPNEIYAFCIVEVWEALNAEKSKTDISKDNITPIILGITVGVIMLGIITVGIILRKRKTVAVPAEEEATSTDEAPPEE